MRFRFAFAMAIVGSLLACASLSAQAQTCPGSHVNLIVHDEKGAAIETAWPGDFQFKGEGTGKVYDWAAAKFNRDSTESLPPEIAKLNDKVWMLTTTGWCIFKNDLTLKLTRSGKTMTLVFHVPELGEYESRDFIVDAPTFSEGTYEIRLKLPTESHRANFFPASAWKKVKVGVGPIRFANGIRPAADNSND